MSTAKNTYKTVDALAIAIQVYKKQGYAKTINIVGEETRKPNKEIVVESLVNMDNPLKQNLPEIDSDSNIQELFDIKKDLMFKKLSGDISDYETQVLGVLDSKEINLGQVGVLSSIPLMLDNMKKREKRQEQYEFFRENSSYVGQLGSKYYGAVTMYQKKYHEKGFWIYTFVNAEKNIVKWLTGKEFPEFDKGAKLKISGVVKAHNDTKFFGKETLLTKCKLIADIERK